MKTILLNFLTDNGLARMYGPYFLIFFGIMIVLALLYIYFMREQAKQNYYGNSLPVTGSEKPNPYALAFIRGGASEAVRLAVFYLQENHFLEPSKAKDKMRQYASPPPLETLNELEKVVYDYVKYSFTVGEVIHSESTLNKAEQICLEWIKTDKFDGFLMDPKARTHFEARVNWIIPAIIFLGIYKFVVSLMNGHDNVFFLFIEMILGTFLLNYQLNKFPKINLAGEKYLNDLNIVYQDLKEKPKQAFEDREKLFIPAIFGAVVFTSFGYAHLNTYAPSSNTFSSSGGCSTSSCGGSSCGGGGCGGCGGGGD